MNAAPLLTLDDYEDASITALPHAHREWIADGAADGITLRANRAAWSMPILDLMPRGAVDVSQLDLSTSLLGGAVRLNWPVLVAPTSYQKLAHPQGELASAAAAAASGTHFVASHAMSYTSEAVADASRAAATVSGAGLWQQLYFLSSCEKMLEFDQTLDSWTGQWSSKLFGCDDADR